MIWSTLKSAFNYFYGSRKVVAAVSQKHGFDFENEIRTKVFKLPPSINNNGKYDIPCENNIYNQDENISIKLSGDNSIDCGDIIRFFNYDFTKTNTIILGRYIQEKDIKKIYEVAEIDYCQELHSILFGTITNEVLQEYVDCVKQIPPGTILKKDKHYLKIKNELQKKYDMLIKISPKVDSNSQRRVQCCIVKIDELFHKYPMFVNSIYLNSEIRGVKINDTINSPPRIRREKNIELV